MSKLPQKIINYFQTEEDPLAQDLLPLPSFFLEEFKNIIVDMELAMMIAQDWYEQGTPLEEIYELMSLPLPKEYPQEPEIEDEAEPILELDDPLAD